MVFIGHTIWTEAFEVKSASNPPQALDPCVSRNETLSFHLPCLLGATSSTSLADKHCTSVQILAQDLLTNVTD